MSRNASYSTVGIAPRDRFAYWREAVCASYVQLGCEAVAKSGFSGTLEIERHAGLSISKVSGSEHSVLRRPADIRAASDADFLVSLQMRNSARLTQSGRTSVLRAGDMAIYDSTRPYVLDLSENFTQTVLQFPRERLLARLPAAQTIGGTLIGGRSGLSRLVRDSVLAFSGHLVSGHPVSGRSPLSVQLEETLIDLVATGLAAVGGAQADLSSPDRQALLRARSFIADHVRDPELDRSRVAAATGLSVRRLNGIFQGEGTSIGAEIRRQRLETVASALRDPRYAGLTISEVAISCGYANLQHFSTQFRAAFGRAPRDYRRDRA
ncbi:AraC-like ligand-binding domain-containing protein [Roseibium sp. M-1]